VERLWDGVAVALVTLFDGEGAVDVGATAEHAARLVDFGVRAVVVAGSTGESDALSGAERVALVAGVRAACPSVPVVAGAGGQWWRPAAQEAEACLRAGADAVLVAPPRRPVELGEFYGALPGPVLGYHFPGVAGGELPVGALGGLPLAGLKDSSGDAERLLSTLDGWRGAVYTGSSALPLLAGAVGAAGAILAVANVAPEDCLAAWSGDGAAQVRLTGPHLAARGRFPSGLKRLVAQRFGTSAQTRLGR
jgi:4-hydroxy-tetrahydrodipicolinate synthase